MDNRNSGGRRETNKTALIILGLVVIALICVTVITLVSMGRRLWGGVSGSGTAALTDIVRSSATGTTPQTGNTVPGTGNPSTLNPGNGAPAPNPGNGAATPNPGNGAATPNPGNGAATPNPGNGAATPNPGNGAATPNPGNIISGADSASEAKEASADSSSDDGGSGDEASEVGVQPAESVKKDSPVFFAPIYGVISKGHDESVVVYSMTMGDYRVHLGVDIEANLGDPVYSCADGVVSEIKDDPFMGTSVVISHGNGYVSFYKNLDFGLPAGVVEGMAVTAGQIIGAVGESAIIEVAESAHLHFEMTVDGAAVNPVDYIEFPEAVSRTFAGE